MSEWIRHRRIRKAHAKRHELLRRLREIENDIDVLQEPDLRREREYWEQKNAQFQNIVERLEKALKDTQA